MMIINLYKDLIERVPEIKYYEIIESLSKSCGIGKMTIKNTLSQYRRTGSVTSPKKSRAKKQLFDKLNDVELEGIRQKVHSFLQKQEQPTLDKILQAVNDDPQLGKFTRTSLHTVLSKMDITLPRSKKHADLKSLNTKPQSH